MPAALGRILGGPGACDQHASGRGGPGFGHGPWLAALTRGVCRGHQPQELQQCSWVRKTRAGAQCGHRGDGHGALHPAPGLQGVDHRTQAPGFALLLPLRFKTSKTGGVVVHRPDIFLEATELSVRERADGICPRPREGTDGCICDPRDLDWGEIP
jgi:hypothetical protein